MRENCKLSLSGNRTNNPSVLFSEMASWCKENNVDHDIYGEGKLINNFEDEVAEYLDFGAALFMVTGTMSQSVALEIACSDKLNQNVAMHPSCHIYLRENQGYQLQNRFKAISIGNPYIPWTLDALKQVPDKLAAAVYELPMREIGGQLPSYNQLNEIKQYCHSENIHFHLDGARLWESAAYYQKSYSEITNGFDSAYVSFYKGIPGLGGAMLLGNKDYIKKARIWMHRQI